MTQLLLARLAWLGGYSIRNRKRLAFCRPSFQVASVDATDRAEFGSVPTGVWVQGGRGAD